LVDKFGFKVLSSRVFAVTYKVFLMSTTNNYTSQSITDTVEVVDVFYSSHGVKQIVCKRSSTLNYLVIVSDAQVVIDVSHMT
jgi:hypothetical protein